MEDVSADEFLSVTKCVLDRFHIYKFSEIKQDTLFRICEKERMF